MADGVGGARRVDPGRVAVVVLFTLTSLSAAARTWTALAGLAGGGPALDSALEVGCGALTVAFCGLVVRAYLRRGTAAATDRRAVVRIAAPLATCLPLVLPALPTQPGGTSRSLPAFVLVLAGTAWSVWAVRHLSSCLSVVPQARALVDTGPYRVVRHPLYLGEIVAVTGFAVRGGHWSDAVVVVALVALQFYRAGQEEVLLAAQVPGYPEYVTRTWRIVPGLG